MSECQCNRMRCESLITDDDSRFGYLKVTRKKIYRKKKKQIFSSVSIKKFDGSEHHSNVKGSSIGCYCGHRIRFSQSNWKTANAAERTNERTNGIYI